MSSQMNFSKTLASFRGRISRGHFWGYFVLLQFISILVAAVWTGLFGETDAMALLIIPYYYCFLALLAKRWHDRDKSGWWSLVLLIPYVGLLWVFIECGCLRGTESANRFGSSGDDSSLVVVSQTPPKKCPVCKSTDIFGDKKWTCAACDHAWT